MLRIHLIANTYNRGKVILITYPTKLKDATDNDMTDVFIRDVNGTHILDISFNNLRYISYCAELTSNSYSKNNFNKIKSIAVVLEYSLALCNFDIHLYTITECFCRNLIKNDKNKSLLVSCIESETNRSKDNLNLMFAQLYNDMRSNSLYYKFNEFIFPTRINQINNSYIDKFHSIIIYKNKINLNFTEVNPTLYILYENLNSMKSLFDFSIEYKIDFNYLSYLVNQLEYWGFARVIKKITYNSILYINNEMIVNSNLEKSNKELKKKYSISIYDVLKEFNNKTSLINHYNHRFHKMNHKNFSKMINYLLENEFLLQCNVYCLFKHKIKEEIIRISGNLNSEHHLLTSSQSLFKSNYKYDEKLKLKTNIPDDSQLEKKIDNVIGVNDSIYSKSSGLKNKNESFREGFKYFINKIPSNDRDILDQIKFYLTSDYTIDEVIHFTGYKENVVYCFIERYKFLFNIIVIKDN